MPAATTQALVSVTPPPPGWSGDLTALFSLLQLSLKVTNPAGYNSFVTGSVAPTTDQGPWLKNGVEWYVWSSVDGGYVPQGLTGAMPEILGGGETIPDTSNTSGAFFWTPPGIGSALYHWGSSGWSYIGGNLRGPTSLRPASPVPYTRFFDSSIGAELYYKPSFGWVTVAGVIGDIKFVQALTLSAATLQNPGWEPLPELYGRTLAGAFGEFNGLTLSRPGQTVGEEEHTLTISELPAHKHSPGSGTHFGNVAAGGSAWGSGGGYTESQSLETAATGGDKSHNNMQPTLYKVCLVKVQ